MTLTRILLIGALAGIGIVLIFLALDGCSTPPLLPSSCCWRADAQVHGWCDVPNTDEVCRRKVGE